jgi:putative flippase GtrA
MSKIKVFLMNFENKYSALYKVFRYVVAGGTAAIVNIGYLFLFTDVFGVWYIISSVFAYVIAFLVSFTLQKYWTFRDYSTDRMAKQGTIYFIIGFINLALNTLLIYLFTDIIGLYYIVSQIISGLLIACISFFVYKNIIFSKTPK